LAPGLKFLFVTRKEVEALRQTTTDLKRVLETKFGANFSNENIQVHDLAELTNFVALLSTDVKTLRSEAVGGQKSELTSVKSQLKILQEVFDGLRMR
jgi:hypothetical protein